MLLTYKKQNFKVAFCDMLADYINYNLSDIIISPLCKIIGLLNSPSCLMNLY